MVKEEEEIRWCKEKKKPGGEVRMEMNSVTHTMIISAVNMPT